MHIELACNQYAWQTFLERAGSSWGSDLDGTLAGIRQAGFRGVEPLIESADQLRQLAPYLQRHDLAMRSLYVNTTLHRDDAVPASVEHVRAIAEAARAVGAEIIVTNPSPISWGGEASKTDAELTTQATALDQLGSILGSLGLTLAYHVHDAEFRHAAREFHHMMLATDPSNVSFCLDPDWTYRGAGFSQVALFDIVAMYGRRITEVHLRQSRDRIWTETFQAGDIDYGRLVATLTGMGVRPHWVVEQAISAASPRTYEVVEAHALSVSAAETLLAPFVA